MPKNKIDIFLDSGAYSAHSKGVKIDIYAYIDFIKANLDNIGIYANLDVIGDAEASWNNQLIMEREGLLPIPCFHLGEDFKYLKRYVAQYDYIALGGVAQAGKDKTTLIGWMDKCWEIICDKKGMPQCKVHGFAVTSLSIMFRYPWYSVDSTSWVLTGRFGNVFVPKKIDGKFIYDVNSHKVAVSDMSPKMADDGQHFTTFSPNEQAEILEYINMKGFVMGKSDYDWVPKDYKPDESKNERFLNTEDAAALRKCIVATGIYVPNEKMLEKVPPGKEVPPGKVMLETIIEWGISNDYKQRDALNIMYFIDLEKNMPKYPWPWKKKGLSGFVGFD